MSEHDHDCPCTCEIEDLLKKILEELQKQRPDETIAEEKK